MVDFKMPRLGEGVVEGRIVHVLVESGQQVQEFQALLEVETDKATIELSAPSDGAIGEIYVEEDGVYPVSTPLLELLQTQDYGEVDYTVLNALYNLKSLDPVKLCSPDQGASDFSPLVELLQSLVDTAKSMQLGHLKRLSSPAHVALQGDLFMTWLQLGRVMRFQDGGEPLGMQRDRIISEAKEKLPPIIQRLKQATERAARPRVFLGAAMAHTPWVNELMNQSNELKWVPWTQDPAFQRGVSEVTLAGISEVPRRYEHAVLLIGDNHFPNISEGARAVHDLIVAMLGAFVGHFGPQHVSLIASKAAAKSSYMRGAEPICIDFDAEMPPQMKNAAERITASVMGD